MLNIFSGMKIDWGNKGCMIGPEEKITLHHCHLEGFAFGLVSPPVLFLTLLACDKVMKNSLQNGGRMDGEVLGWLGLG